MPWPQNMKEHIFATHTAIVGPKILYETLKQKVDDEAEDLAKEKMLEVKSLKTIMEERILKANKTVSLRSHLREQILTDEVETRQVKRRVKIESIDFDWVFNQNNAQNFLMLLSRQAKSKLLV